MRRLLPALLAFLLLPLTSAQSAQDSLLDEVANYGDADYFERHPGLLVVKVSMLSQLQAAQLSPAELDGLAGVMDRLRELQRVGLNLTVPTYDAIGPAYESLAVLRAGIVGLTSDTVATYQPLLRLAIDTELQTLIEAVDDLAPTRNRTEERVRLLQYGRDAAQLVQDPLDFSRLDASHRAVQERYEADTTTARAALDRGQALLDEGMPLLFGAQFPAHYAALLSAEDDLTEAQRLYMAHGEPENAADALAVQQQVSAAANSMALRILAPIVAGLAAVLLVGFAAARQIVHWAYDRSLARAGDELALQV